MDIVKYPRSGFFPSSCRIYFRLSFDLLLRKTVSSQVLVSSSPCFLVIPDTLYVVMEFTVHTCSSRPRKSSSCITKALFHVSWLSLRPPTPRHPFPLHHQLCHFSMLPLGLRTCRIWFALPSTPFLVLAKLKSKLEPLHWKKIFWLRVFWFYFW